VVHHESPEFLFLISSFSFEFCGELHEWIII
jgi:hypothetical protein